MTPYEIAETFNGIKERPGDDHHPAILLFFEVAGAGEWVPQDDETPWCSAFVYYVAAMCQMDRPMQYKLRARSWLRSGAEIQTNELRVGYDIVILKRGIEPQPGPATIDAPGHVGFYGGQGDQFVYLLGGNQKDSVCTSGYAKNRILGCRRLVRAI